MLIFPHINKTAGMTMQAQIKEGAAGKYLLDYHDTFPYSGYNILESEQGAAENTIRYYDIIFGHFNIDKYKNLIGKNSIHLLCFLRDPVERTISHYYYWKKLIDENSFPLSKYNLISGIDNFFSSSANIVDFANHYYFRNFYKIYFRNYEVKDFSFIGITEEFKQSIQIINEKFSTLFYFSKENTANHHNDLKEIRKYHSDIKKANEENYHYYNLALQTFWNK